MTDLIIELRRDLPKALNRHHQEAAILQLPMDPVRMLAALDERGGPDNAPTAAETPVSAQACV